MVYFNAVLYPKIIMFFHRNVWENVKDMIMNEFPSDDPEAPQKLVNLVKECLAEHGHMTVLPKDCNTGIHDVIIQALLKGL